jgi:hypothetical protein
MIFLLVEWLQHQESVPIFQQNSTQVADVPDFMEFMGDLLAIEWDYPLVN